MFNFKKLVVKYLKEVAEKIEAGTSEITESQAVDILRIVAHEVLTKEQACNYLNMSRSKFDGYVREGIIPKGRKTTGSNELKWYKDELDTAAYKFQNAKKVGG